MATLQAKKSLINRIEQGIKPQYVSRRIETVEDIENVVGSFIAHLKNLENRLFEEGCKLGSLETRLKITTKMVKTGMNNTNIRKFTGLSLEKIRYIRLQEKKE
jgi:archaellum component FlaC